MHTGAHHFWEFCEVCFLIVLAWPGSLFASSVFLPKFCLGPGICCILLGQSQPSGVVGFKKNIVYCHYACISELYSWEWRRGLVVVSVTSLHPPASSNRAIKMGKNIVCPCCYWTTSSATSFHCPLKYLLFETLFSTHDVTKVAQLPLFLLSGEPIFSNTQLLVLLSFHNTLRSLL